MTIFSRQPLINIRKAFIFFLRLTAIPPWGAGGKNAVWKVHFPEDTCITLLQQLIGVVAKLNKVFTRFKTYLVSLKEGFEFGLFLRK
jgi:hypothetical protein